jgi:hypothetical protein
MEVEKEEKEEEGKNNFSSLFAIESFEEYRKASFRFSGPPLDYE